MWLRRPETGARLLSIFIDLREYKEYLPPELREPPILATLVSAHLRELGYPLSHPLMYFCYEAGLWTVDIRSLVERSKEFSKLQRNEIFTVVGGALRDSVYSGEELIVSMHTDDCAVVSFEPTHRTRTRW